MDKLQKIIDVCELLKKHGKFNDEGFLINSVAFEICGDSRVWRTINDIVLSDVIYNIIHGFDFRLKPEYRAFKDAKEFFPHRNKWIKFNCEVDLIHATTITAFNDLGVHIGGSEFLTTYENLFNERIFINDDLTTEPCGVKE